MPVKGVFQHPALFSKRQTADQGNAIISPREGTEDSVERNAARKIGVNYGDFIHGSLDSSYLLSKLRGNCPYMSEHVSMMKESA